MSKLRAKAEAMLAASQDPEHAPTIEETRRVMHELGVHQIELELQNEMLRESGEELAASRDSYRDLYDNAPVGYATLAPDGAVIQANLTLAAMLGKAHQDVVGRKFFCFVADTDELYLHLRRVFQEGIPKIAQLRGAALGGEQPWLELRTRRVTGEPETCWTTVIDVTERKRMELELVEAKLAAESASLAKTEFLSNMSHEIRNPMNAILGLTSLVLKLELPGKQREFLDGVMDAGNSLMQILNNVLDYSKIEAGQLELDSDRFALRVMLGRIMKSFTPQAQKQDIALGMHVDDDVPDNLWGDQGRLRQILVNLLSNALKFTETGAVDMTVRLQPSLRDPAVPDGVIRLLFEVRDSGIGIPSNKQDAIFESFVQADSTTTKIFGGTGLGLAISKKLVHKMRGDIWVDSEPGKGATFRFTASFDPPGIAVQETLRAGTPSASGTARPPLRILVGEDDRINQIFAKNFLMNAGHTVVIATSGKQVLDMLAEHPFDLILMDVSMPEMDGVEATRAIRSSKAGTFDPNIPIIAMTAHALKGDRERFLAAGMTGFISKPIAPESLAQLERVYDRSS